MTSLPRSFAVIGAHFETDAAAARKAVIVECRPGESVTLHRTRGFLRSRYPIEVRSARDCQIGYIHAEQAGPLLARLDAIKAIFVNADTFGAAVRVSFDGAAPALPVDRRSKPKRKRDWPPPPPRDEYSSI